MVCTTEQYELTRSRTVEGHSRSWSERGVCSPGRWWSRPLSRPDSAGQSRRLRSSGPCRGAGSRKFQTSWMQRKKKNETSFSPHTDPNTTWINAIYVYRKCNESIDYTLYIIMYSLFFLTCTRCLTGQTLGWVCWVCSFLCHPLFSSQGES